MTVERDSDLTQHRVYLSTIKAPALGQGPHPQGERRLRPPPGFGRCFAPRLARLCLCFGRCFPGFGRCLPCFVFRLGFGHSCSAQRRFERQAVAPGQGQPEVRGLHREESCEPRGQGMILRPGLRAVLSFCPSVGFFKLF